MEDFYIDDKELDIEDSQVRICFYSMEQKLIERQKNTFDFLVSVKQLLMCLNLENQTENLKYKLLDNGKYFLPYLEERYNFKANTIYKISKTCNKLIILDGRDSNFKYLIEELHSYTLSKLFELLPLSNEQIKKAFESEILTKKSTVKQIREYVKNLKGGTKKENVVLEENSDDFEEDCLYDADFDNRPDTYLKLKETKVEIFKKNLSKLNFKEYTDFYKYEEYDCKIQIDKTSYEMFLEVGDSGLSEKEGAVIAKTIYEISTHLEKIKGV